MSIIKINLNYLDVKPTPRARVNPKKLGSVFNTEKYKAYKKLLTGLIALQFNLEDYGIDKLDWLILIFYNTKKADNDNLTKAIKDVLVQEGIIKDDNNQIIINEVQMNKKTPEKIPGLDIYFIFNEDIKEVYKIIQDQ